MKREFLAPKAPFHPSILYKDKGELKWHKLENMPINEQRIILMKLEDNLYSCKKVIDARQKGAKTPMEVLLRVIPQVWGKLSIAFDIDEDTLNFEL